MGSFVLRPSVTVAVCTRNRPAALARCIASVCAQDTLPDEIIVVDDGQLTPAELFALEQQAKDREIPWTYLAKSEPGLTRSRNLALARAKGRIVQFLDDDAELCPGFLSEIVALFSSDAGEEIAVLGGHLVEPGMGGLGGQFWRCGAAVAGWWSVGARGRRRGPWPDRMDDEGRVIPTLRVIGAALAVRRDRVWPPGFDESLTGYALGEDREVACRLSRRYLVGCATRARAIHHSDVAGRLDTRSFGFFTVYNYCYILNKTLSMGVGEWVAVLWSFIVLGLVRLVFAARGDARPHLAELAGMIQGGGAWLWRYLNQNGCCW